MLKAMIVTIHLMHFSKLSGIECLLLLCRWQWQWGSKSFDN
jgi:hypothetical protein